MRNHRNTVVIGAGQAGLAASWWLVNRGVDHVVLERGRVAEKWRSQRWDSFTLLSPNWQTRLPGHAYFGPDPEGFMTGAEVLDVGRDAIWLTLQLCAPVLIVGLVVGVGIGLLQALTQIQEQTLVYAPKIVAVFVSLLIFLPLMGALMSGFMRNIAARIAGM